MCDKTNWQKHKLKLMSQTESEQLQHESINLEKVKLSNGLSCALLVHFGKNDHRPASWQR